MFSLYARIIRYRKGLSKNIDDAVLSMPYINYNSNYDLINLNVEQLQYILGNLDSPELPDPRGSTA